MIPQILVLAFGNPGRQDDGLGPRCAELLEHYLAEQQPPLPVRIESNYQLTVEDSLAISQVNKVIFIDAMISLKRDFQFTVIAPRPKPSWNHHLLSPQELLYLASTLFSKTPQGYLLAIEGYQFNQFEERLSLRAEDNMHRACHYLQRKLYQWTSTA